MANKQDVIIELLMKEQGVVEALSKIKDTGVRIQKTIELMKALATQAETSFETAAKAVAKYNELIEARQGSTGLGNMVGTPVKDVDWAANLKKQQEQQEKWADAQTKKNLKSKLDAINKEDQAREAAHRKEMERIKREEEAELKKGVAGLKITEDQMAKLRTGMESIRAMPAGDQAAGLGKLALEMEKMTGIRFDDYINRVGKELGMSNAQMAQAAKKANEMKIGFGGMLKQIFDIKNVMNTAFGVFTAMMLFNITQLLAQIPVLLKNIVDQANAVTRAFQDLSIAEKQLSESGIAVTGKDMVETITKWQQMYSLIAKEDLAKNLAQATTTLADSGLTYEQIVKVAEVAMDNAIQYGKDFSEVFSSLNAYLVSGEQGRAKQYGLAFDEETVKQRAKELGFLTETDKKLSDLEKRQTIYSLLVEKSAEKHDAILQSQTNLNNASTMLETAWKNLTGQGTELATVWNSILFFVAEVLNTMAGRNTGITKFWENLKQSSPIMTFLLESFQRLVGIVSWIGSNLVAPFAALTGVLERIKNYYEWATRKKISDQPGQGQLEKQDTPTNIQALSKRFQEADDDVDDSTKNIMDNIINLIEWLDKLGDKAREMREDFNRETEQLNADFATNQLRAQEDYLHDQWEINNEFNQKLEEANAEYRKNEIDREAKFQEELRQLREKFLFSLEDALRERDARQVLRLVREYEMNRQNMINEHALQKQQDARNHADELQQIADERAARLAELKYEYELRKQRELEDFNLRMARRQQEHDIEMERLRKDIEDKIREISNGIAEELGVDLNGADRIYKALSQYYGSNGAITKLYTYTYDGLVTSAQRAHDQILKLFGDSITMVSQLQALGILGENPTSMSDTLRGLSLPGFADGGMVVASKPTAAMFGEKGPEAAMFLPLNRLSEAFGGMRGLGGGSAPSGQVGVRVTLSPELRAEIVEDSLNQVAAVLEYTSRT